MARGTAGLKRDKWNCKQPYVGSVSCFRNRFTAAVRTMCRRNCRTDTRTVFLSTYGTTVRRKHFGFFVVRTLRSTSTIRSPPSPVFAPYITYALRHAWRAGRSERYNYREPSPARLFIRIRARLYTKINYFRRS